MLFLSLGFIHYFFNLLNFYPFTLFLVTPLLVTALLCLVIPLLEHMHRNLRDNISLQFC